MAGAASDQPHRAAITVCVMAATLMQALDSTIANIALPFMQGSFSASQDQIDWVLTSYIVAAAIATPPTGWLSGRFGRKRLFMVAVGGFTVASMLCGLAQTLDQMVLFRLLQGICGASLVPLSQAVLLDVYPVERQGSAMALWGVGVMVGPIIGPTLGGWLTEHYNWRWVFFINLPIGLLTFLGLTTFLSEKRRLENLPFDWFGFTTLSVAVGALQLLIDRGEQLDWFGSREIVIETGIALIAFYLFAVQTFTTKHPFISPTLFKDRNFSVAVCFIFMIGLVLFATLALLAPFMQSLMGYPILTAGVTLATRGAGTIISMFISGRLVGKIDMRGALIVGLLLMLHSLYLMTGFTADVAQSALAWTGFEQGLGLGFITVTLATTAFSTLNPALRTEGAGVFSLARNVGSAIGISLFATLLQQSTQRNHAEISSYVTPYNRMLDAGTVAGLMGQNGAPIAAGLDAIVTREAVTIGYLDDFKAMTVISIVLLPLVFLLRPPRRASTTAAIPNHAAME